MMSLARTLVGSGWATGLGLVLLTGACESKSDSSGGSSTAASSTSEATGSQPPPSDSGEHTSASDEHTTKPATTTTKPAATDVSSSRDAGDAVTSTGGEMSSVASDVHTSESATSPSAAGSESTGPSKDPETTGQPADPCGAPDLVWRTANKTNYESYPDPGSEECIEFNGCTWEGLFAACDDKMPEQWVSEHNIVAAFPDFQELELHDLCLRKGDKTIVVTVFDTCGDSDCDGCCTENKGSADELIDLEKYTNERWGVPDGEIEWADLGPTAGAGCE